MTRCRQLLVNPHIHPRHLLQAAPGHNQPVTVHFNMEIRSFLIPEHNIFHHRKRLAYKLHISCLKVILIHHIQKQKCRIHRIIHRKRIPLRKQVRHQSFFCICHKSPKNALTLLILPNCQRASRKRNHRIPPPVRKIRKTSHNTLPTCRCPFRNILTRTHRQPLSHRIRNPGLFRNRLLPLLFPFYPQRNPFLIPLIHIIRETIHNKKDLLPAVSRHLKPNPVIHDSTSDAISSIPRILLKKQIPPDPLLLHLKLPICPIRKNHTIARNALPVHRKILPLLQLLPLRRKPHHRPNRKTPLLPTSHPIPDKNRILPLNHPNRLLNFNPLHPVKPYRQTPHLKSFQKPKPLHILRPIHKLL